MMKLKELCCIIFGFALAMISSMIFDLNLPLTETVANFKHVHKSSTKFDEIARWSNNIPALKTQDVKRSLILSQFMEKYYKIEKPSEEEVREIFYQVLSQPLQTVCNFPKKIGGKNSYHYTIPVTKMCLS